MRDLSVAFRQAMFAPATNEVVLILLTIQHPVLTTPIRVVNNTVNITSRGNEFIAFPFELRLPESQPDQIPQTQLVIDNVDRRLMAAVRTLQGEAVVTLEIVLASNPNNVEIGPIGLTLKSVDYDAFSITGTLGAEPILDAPFPGYDYTPVLFPGIFPI